MGFLHYDTVVVNLVSQINTLMDHFTHDGYNALADALRLPLISMGGLFIILTGYGITHGFIKAPLQELYKFIIRIGFIYFFAMNWGNFSYYVVGLFDEGASQLGSVVMKASNTPMRGNSIAEGLQSVLNDVFRVGWWTMRKATIRNWWPYYTAWFIWLSGMAVVVVALFELIVAKVMLSICLATAPLFLICTLFDKTRAFFDKWLGSVVGFSLVFVFVSMVVGMCMSLVYSSISGYLPNEASDMNQVGWAPLFLVACLSVACLFQAANIAKHIGGACHTAGGGAMVGGLVGGAVGAAMFVHQAGKAWQDFREGKSSKGGLGADPTNLAGGLQEQLTNRGEV